MISRKTYIRKAIAISFIILALPLMGLYEGSRFQFAQIQYDGNWDPRPRAYRRLISSLELRTSVNVSYKRKTIRLDDPDLFNYPFLYLAGDSNFEPFTPEEIRKLRKFLKLGGTLIIDDVSGSQDSDFDSQIRQELVNIIPEVPIKPISQDHVVYKSFYLLNSASGRKIVKPYLEGITFNDEDRTAVFYSRNDLGGAWSEDEFGKWEFEAVPGGEAQRERAISWVLILLCMHLLGIIRKTRFTHHLLKEDSSISS